MYVVRDSPTEALGARFSGLQGCQIVYFHTEIPILE
jgi:hypothetical protein